LSRSIAALTTRTASRTIVVRYCCCRVEDHVVTLRTVGKANTVVKYCTLYTNCTGVDIVTGYTITATGHTNK
jgi:hypothetical protein